MPALFAALVYQLGYWVFAFALIIGSSLRGVGHRNVPRRGPVLIIANHESFVDPVAVGLVAGRHLTYLARKTLFASPVTGAMLRTVNCVPIDQEGVGKEGIRTIIQKLQAGHAVLVFPEGERTLGGEFQSLRPGIALLLSRVAVPIVAAGVAGAYEAWPRNRAWPTLSPIFLPPTNRTIAVSIGPPRDPSTLKGMTRQQILDTLHNDIAIQIRRAEQARRK